MNKIQTYILTATFFSIPIVATLKGKGTFILALVLFLTFGLKHINKTKNLFDKIKNFEHASVSFWAVIFSLWIGLSCLWAPAPLKAFSHFLRYSGLILTGYLTFQAFRNFDKQGGQKYTKIFVTAFVVFLAYMVFEVFGPHWISLYYTKSDIFDKRLFINAVVILLLFFWPFFLFCQKKWGAKAYKVFLFLGLPFSIFLFLKTQPHAVLFGVVLSTLGIHLSLWSHKWIKFFKFVILSICLILPLMASQDILLEKFSDEINLLPPSYQHRLYLWNGMVNKNDTLVKKAVGNGFDYSTTIKGGKEMCFRQLKIKFTLPSNFHFELEPPCKEPSAIFSCHPHNGLIQIYVELGIIGLLIFLALLWKVFGVIENQKDKILRGVWFAILISYLTIFFISFGLWQTWMAGLMILTLNSLFVISKYYKQKT